MGNLAAGRKIYSELKNVCVWNKTNAGMGSFYRSKHELVFVFKNGTAAHINNLSWDNTVERARMFGITMEFPACAPDGSKNLQCIQR